jgi:dTDP-4-amino-4,6-dideoxygalactose transaminase
MGGAEEAFVAEAFASNYIAPIGPMVDAFEREFSAYTGIPHCVALASGTSAIHLALREALERAGLRGKSPGSGKPVVLASTLTFIGSVSPATFEGCELRFIDCDEDSWNMDPRLLEEELSVLQKAGRTIAAVIPTDLYGQSCNVPLIRALCDRFHVPLICDSAEAMGAQYLDSDRDPRLPETRNLEPETAFRHAGTGAWAAAYSFNGNKIITTSGGGMLASFDKNLIDHARKLSTQARDPAPHYEHTEIGYNYRMSNILAAIGRGQLMVLDERVRRKREITEIYRSLLADLPGITLMPEPGYSRSTRWLTVIRIDQKQTGFSPETARIALEKERIESRPVWKPMHLQPVFSGAAIRGGAVSEAIFREGLCLPSGTALTNDDLARIVGIITRRRS